MGYDTLPPEQEIEAVIAALKRRGTRAELVRDRGAALARLKELIPAGVSVMTGASTTLDQIGFTDLLVSGEHPWNNLKTEVVAETDPERLLWLRRRAVLADYFLGSVHAITHDGDTVTASASGSQLPGYSYCSGNVIWVAGAQKIVPDLNAALRRIREYTFPLEDARMKSTGAAGSAINKILVFSREINPNRGIHMILVKEKLGF